MRLARHRASADEVRHHMGIEDGLPATGKSG